MAESKWQTLDFYGDGKIRLKRCEVPTGWLYIYHPSPHKTETLMEFVPAPDTKLRAEVEALRAEVERLRKMLA